MLDERDDSINDGLFVVVMGGFLDRPAQLSLVDYPASYHNGAGGFNFADGHAEIHKWRNGRTNPTYQKDVHLTILPGGNPIPSPKNPVVLGLQERATGKR